MKDGRLIFSDSDGAGQAELPENFLIEYEWPWRAVVLDTPRGGLQKTFWVPAALTFQVEQAESAQFDFE